MKTIKLSDRPRVEHERVSDILTGAMLIAVLYSLGCCCTARLPLWRCPRQHSHRFILIATQTAIVPPTAVPATPQVIFITLPTPEPEVIYVQSPPEVVYVEAPAPAVATPAPATAEPQLQTIAVSPDEELSPAILREAMDR